MGMTVNTNARSMAASLQAMEQRASQATERLKATRSIQGDSLQSQNVDAAQLLRTAQEGLNKNFRQIIPVTDSISNDVTLRKSQDLELSFQDLSNRSGAAYRVELSGATRNVSSSNNDIVSTRTRLDNIDVAAESSKFVRNSMLQQAGTAMLAQANQTPQGVLELLR